MTNTSIAAKIHQALDAHRYLASQVTLDGVLADLGSKPFQHILRELAYFLSRFDPDGSADLPRARAADAVYIGKTYDSVLVIWNVNSC